MHEVDGGKTIRIILRDCIADLRSVDFSEQMIRGLCRFLGMTQIGEPFAQCVSPGLSCGLIIAESHIFIHTWPESASARVVIDSCVDFDHNAAAEWLKDVYGAGKYEYHVL
jgi:S-adenosylmethionine/arginine decarboxylase-like enzyme